MSRPEPIRALAGRRALVTGAAAGLGSAFARRLIEGGATVVGVDRVAFEAPALTACLTGDVSVAVDVERCVAEAAERLGGLDLLVNNAGLIDRTDLLTASLDEALAVFDRVIGTNLRGAYAVGRAAIPHLVKAGSGDIVNIVTDHLHTCGWPWQHAHDEDSTCAFARVPRPPVTSPSVDAYDASKWGLLGTTGVWAHALAPHGIRVNAMGMGATDTPMYRTTRGDRGPEAGTMSADDVAGVLVALLEEGPTGRTGDNVQLWIGHPCELPPPTRAAQLAPRVGQPTG